LARQRGQGLWSRSGVFDQATSSSGICCSIACSVLMPVEPSRECGESGAIRHLGQLRKNPTEQMAEAVALVHPGDWRTIFFGKPVSAGFLIDSFTSRSKK